MIIFLVPFAIFIFVSSKTLSSSNDNFSISKTSDTSIKILNVIADELQNTESVSSKECVHQIIEENIAEKTTYPNAHPNDSSSEAIAQVKEEVLYLPPAPSDENEERVRQIKLGETISMDELGPIIVNSDGTIRRITNWNNLTKQEKESALRLISARNKKRIKAIQDAKNDSNL
eukprot:gene5877-8104_t